jgi:predicted RNA-binding Zn-ribbon protein involved in translation (DUF1610 family)
MSEEQTQFKKCDEKDLDPKKMIESERADTTSDVEGQFLYWRYGVCPACGQALRVRASTDMAVWYRCLNCGHGFRV